MKSRFFGELKIGLNILIGPVNSCRSSVLMNDAKDMAELGNKVLFINNEMNEDIALKFFKDCENVDIISENINIEILVELIKCNEYQNIYIDNFYILLENEKIDLSYTKELIFKMSMVDKFGIDNKTNVVITQNILNDNGVNIVASSKNILRYNTIQLIRNQNILTINDKEFEFIPQTREIIERKEM